MVQSPNLLFVKSTDNIYLPTGAYDSKEIVLAPHSDTPWDLEHLSQ